MCVPITYCVHKKILSKKSDYEKWVKIKIKTKSKFVDGTKTKQNRKVSDYLVCASCKICNILNNLSIDITLTRIEGKFMW